MPQHTLRRLASHFAESKYFDVKIRLDTRFTILSFDKKWAWLMENIMRTVTQALRISGIMTLFCTLKSKNKIRIIFLLMNFFCFEHDKKAYLHPTQIFNFGSNMQFSFKNTSWKTSSSYSIKKVLLFKIFND